MAHAHDQTLLNRLGFSDPDKKLKRHDLAARYAMQPQVLRRILGHHDEVKVSKPEFEHVISKGSGQYRQHIGFADAVASLSFRCRAHKTTWEAPECDALACVNVQRVLLEVKITPVSGAEILRQLKLYLTYLNTFGLKFEPVVVVDFPLDEGDQQALLAENCRVVRLGKGFQEWMEKQASSTADLAEI